MIITNPQSTKIKKTKSVPSAPFQERGGLQSESESGESTESGESGESGESKIQIINKELRFSTLLLSPIFFFIKKLTTNY